jgi:hypothetical protein
VPDRIGSRKAGQTGGPERVLGALEFSMLFI